MFSSQVKQSRPHARRGAAGSSTIEAWLLRRFRAAGFKRQWVKCTHTLVENAMQERQRRGRTCMGWEMLGT